jgi:tetratricopeptide (TPR) repeat protein
MRLARDTHERYLRRHDRAVPDALRCTLNLAAAHAAVGENDRARELAAKARAACAASLGGGHPNTLAAANNLAIYLRCTGDLPQALQLAEHTLAKLRGTLGDEHPFSLVSAVNLAACLGDAEDLPRAGSLQRNALRDFQKKLGPRHPDTLACQAGLAVTLHRAGQDEEAEHVRARILEVLAYVDDNHPDITLLRDWRYISRDLDAPPV